MTDGRDKSGRDAAGFERALRDWGRRSPRTPAEVAATRVAARVGPRGHRLPRWRLLAATTAAAVIAGGIWLGTVDRMLPSLPADPAGPVTSLAPPLDDNVVLWWLDAETPVYFAIEPPKDGGGE